MIYQFLNWYLGQRTGKGGRSKRLVRSRNSLITFWCCFRLAFQRATAYKIDAVIDRDLMYNVSLFNIHVLYLLLAVCGPWVGHGGSCWLARLVQLRPLPTFGVFKADICLGHGETEQTIQIDTQEAAE